MSNAWDILVTDSRGTRFRRTVEADSANEALKDYMGGAGTRPYKGSCSNSKGTKRFTAIPEVTP